MQPSSRFPIVHTIDVEICDEQIAKLFQKFASRPYAIFLDGSGNSHPTESLNRFSFLMADPIDEVIVQKDCDFNWSDLRLKQLRYQTQRNENLPPFQGGIAGLISYEFNNRLEEVPSPKIDEFQIPQLSMFVYDVVLAIDHSQNRSWLISQGWSQDDQVDRLTRAEKRLEQFLELIGSPLDEETTRHSHFSTTEIRTPMNRMDSSIELYSDFSKSDFLATVAKAVDYIHAGDVFQVNLSQRLLTPATKSSTDLYLDMRAANPAPFSGFMDFGGGQLISASPERLLSVSDRIVESRPIKGTRKRTHYPEVDLYIREQLLDSEKDRAENIMIVDLMRNDLSRIAKPDSVLVKKLCGVEPFQNVLHLVSVIQCELDDRLDSIDALNVVFPGGSITGAPKIRAMEIISELEPTARGPYCGSLGYISPDGQMDFNILIRSVTAKDGWWQIPVGGGIVSDSIPELEYEETWTKAIGMLQAITRNKNQSAPPKPKFHRPATASK